MQNFGTFFVKKAAWLLTFFKSVSRETFLIFALCFFRNQYIGELMYF